MVIPLPIANMDSIATANLLDLFVSDMAALRNRTDYKGFIFDSPGAAYRASALSGAGANSFSISRLILTA
jgi:hypothetical protein